MKKNLITIIFIISIILTFTIPNFAKDTKKPLIQLAILLDTSGSMEGLIEQTKTYLWKIVNELALAKKNDITPDLNVGLYEYGKSSLPGKEGFLRMIVPLTTDLDKISEELFKLKTNGGQEYCGQVIKSATEELNWSGNNKDLKLIFIAGNEPFTQGKYDYQTACKNAIKKSIIVNTIFCGDYNEGIRTSWKQGADLADGQYINIDQNQKIVHITAPQDTELIKLGEQLNKTYIAYGKGGASYKNNQVRQDANALNLSSQVMVERSLAKASKHYINSTWDIVDAVNQKSINLNSLEKKILPEKMRGMTLKEKKDYIHNLTVRREKIQNRINLLNKERQKYIQENIKKQNSKGSKNNRLDNAIIDIIHNQAKKQNFKIVK